VKYSFLAVILLVCGLAYLRYERPKIWNDYITGLKAPENASSIFHAAVPRVASASVATNPPKPPPVSEIVSPNTSASSTQASQAEEPAASNTDTVANSPRVFIPPNPIPAQPNWTWSVLGKTYTNVVIRKVEAECVTITHDSGGGRIDISLLPADIQKMLNYDPELAAQTATEKRKEEADAYLLQKQKQQEDAIRRQEEQTEANAAQASAPHAFGRKSLSPEQRAAIEARILSLKVDVDFLQREVAKENLVDPITGAVTPLSTHGAYSDRIDVEQAQIDQLKAQLQ
jgi:hypothetical protein